MRRDSSDRNSIPPARTLRREDARDEHARKALRDKVGVERKAARVIVHRKDVEARLREGVGA